MIRAVRQADAVPTNDTGFTLIEVLIAMAILSVGLLSIGVAQPVSAHGEGDPGGLGVAPRDRAQTDHR